MFDANLMLRTDAEANLTADELTRTGVDFGEGDIRPLTYKMIVPQANAAVTLDAAIEMSDTLGGTYIKWMQYEQVTTAKITAGRKEYYVTGVCPKRFRRVSLDVGGTTPDFGKVVVGVSVVGDAVGR